MRKFLLKYTWIKRNYYIIMIQSKLHQNSSRNAFMSDLLVYDNLEYVEQEIFVFHFDLILTIRFCRLILLPRLSTMIPSMVKFPKIKVGSSHTLTRYCRLNDYSNLTYGGGKINVIAKCFCSKITGDDTFIFWYSSDNRKMGNKNHCILHIDAYKMLLFETNF